MSVRVRETRKKTSLKKQRSLFVKTEKEIQYQTALIHELLEVNRHEFNNTNSPKNIIFKMLQWYGCENIFTALSLDKETNQILVNKDFLMMAIQLANPGQPYRDIRLITGDEFLKLANYRNQIKFD